ncbi:MAG: pyrroline-5-carboxylate reductase [Desulfitobacterium hafniense]|nr:pyrroline-5-carboxylate reductase [Desulfitobacterium hafniense]
MVKKLGFIGAGNMAEAIIKGVRSSDKVVKIMAANKSNQERMVRLNKEYSVISGDVSDVVQNSEVIVLAVKPKDFPNLLLELSKYKLGDKLVISVAAGITLEFMQKHLLGTSIVRAMPNTSSAVLQSMTGLVKGNLVTEDQAEVVEQIFSNLGKTIWIPEDKMNALIALSGSGPAYFYLFTECLTKAGVELGLDQSEAETLARETIIGAGKMLANGNKSAAKLREDVTSPNGTTFAALTVFWNSKVEEIVLNAAKACAIRASEMEGEYSR